MSHADGAASSPSGEIRDDRRLDLSRVRFEAGLDLRSKQPADRHGIGNADALPEVLALVATQATDVEIESIRRATEQHLQMQSRTKVKRQIFEFFNVEI